jgi:pyrimidine-nucleoside phosphorylase
MNQPLGYAVGNALEVREAVETLRGGGPADFREHCLTIAAHMLLLGGQAADLGRARAQAAKQLDDRSALAVFRAFVRAQGGDDRICDDDATLPAAPCRGTLAAERAGCVAQAHAGRIGSACVRLGAGRARKDDPVDPAVGVVLRAKVGQSVKEGDALCEVHARTPESLASALEELKHAFAVKQGKVRPLPLFYQTIR